MAGRLLALLLAAFLAQGCFVFEELQKGEETMDRLSQASESEEESAGESSSGEGSESGEAKQPDPDAWWRKARTLTPGGSSGGSADEGEAASGAEVVRCRLADGARFMRRDECLGRGGRPAG